MIASGQGWQRRELMMRTGLGRMGYFTKELRKRNKAH